MENCCSVWTARSKRRFGRYILLSLVGLSFPLGLGSYQRSVNSGESYHQFYKFPKSDPRPVILNYNKGGILHRLISSHALSGTLSLTNTGKPSKVAIRMFGVPDGLTIHWEDSHTRYFNLETKEVENIVGQGDSIAVHHTYYIGKKLRQRKVIFNGCVEIMDTESKEILLTIPIKILNSDGVRRAETEAPHNGS